MIPLARMAGFSKRFWFDMTKICLKHEKNFLISVNRLWYRFSFWRCIAWSHCYYDDQHKGSNLRIASYRNHNGRDSDSLQSSSLTNDECSSADNTISSELAESLSEFDESLYWTHRIPDAGHSVVLVQPRIKWGPKKKINTTPELQLQEAIALTETLPGWKIVAKMIIPITNPKKKLMFGSGNLEKIKQVISANRTHISAVFISWDILTSVQQSELAKVFGYPVYDRYTIVLQIFHNHARTREAKLQIALAEIPYIRSRLKELYEKGKGNRYILGSGENFFDMKKKMLMERESKIRRELEELKKKRQILRLRRTEKEFPIVAVVGYTNAGKTSLIKALSNDQELEPKNQLFATLDVTAHAGILPSFLKVLYMDTVGFIADIPTTLIQSFTATLEDVMLADLIIHVRDISHPDKVAQKETVLDTLMQLNLPNQLLNSILEVGNKIDLVDESANVSEEDGENVYFISATKGLGVGRLCQEIENRILTNTGRVLKTFRVPMGGDESRWLYKESGVKSAVACNKDPNFLIMEVIITEARLGKFNSYFGDLTYRVNL